jgi:hypothetical protein
MELRQQLKRVQEPLLKAAQHPMVPHDLRTGIAELLALCGALIVAIETLKGEFEDHDHN